MKPAPLPNPFPGLRPFEPGEEHVFFGRETQTDDLLRRLGSHRFLSVVGTSASGKSSLVRSGLIPALHGGFMAAAGSTWRVSMMRPGEDPIGHLAQALDEVIGAREGELASTNRVRLDATLRRGTLGLVEAVRLSRLPTHDNVLILVDQFEELFRFRRSRDIENSRDEAVAFVKLLLEATSHHDVPIYVVLTMRSDFIGDCMDYPGLPEAVNESQYLVPRMSREELRSAIVGPVAVAGGRIAPRLVQRILNDLGDDHDQLSLMQHVLMRTWDHWQCHRQPDDAIDLPDYDAVGTLRHALSMHAEEAYEETGSERRRQVAERIFKSLTDTFSDQRGVRRPTSVRDLALIGEVSEAEIIEIAEIFRRPGRSFLMPPPSVPLTSQVIVDLSHESLMRGWERLKTWAGEERISARQYVRLSHEAALWERGEASLWGDPELELGLRWRQANRPTAAWARRYDQSFDRAMRFLDSSEQERARARAERRAQRIRNLQIAWGSAAVLLILLLVAAIAYQMARRERGRAEANLHLAKAAVDETLAATDRDPARLGADVPQLEEFRRDLLERAKGFYSEFITQKPDSEEFLNELAFAHFRLGHIERMLDQRREAVGEYQNAIAQFGELTRDHPDRREYRQALANAYNWLGETLRATPEGHHAAARAYEEALRLQNDLVQATPGDATYGQELARTHYNRAILYGETAEPGDANFKKSEADVRDAIRLLEPLVQAKAGDHVSEELARAYNNLANLRALDTHGAEEAQRLYDEAIRIHESLVANDPRNREYKLELAQFRDNLAGLLHARGRTDAAADSNARALTLIEELSLPAPSLGIEQADAYNLRGFILQTRGSLEATTNYRRSLMLFQTLARKTNVVQRPEFHRRFGDLLQNLAGLRSSGHDVAAQALFRDAVEFYAALGRNAAAAGSRSVVERVLDNLSSLMPLLNDADRRFCQSSYESLRQLPR